MQAELFEIAATPQAPARAWVTTSRLCVQFPERSGSCSIERLSCANLGLQRTRVIIWADFAYAPWEALHDDTSWQAPASGRGDENRIEHTAGRVRLDIRFIPEAPATALGNARLLEAGRVLGHLTLDGETVILSGSAVMERTWQLTPESPEVKLVRTFAHATSDDGTAFVATDQGGGWLRRYGQTVALVECRRSVEERVGPYPHRVRIEMRDGLGRTLEASGRARNGMVTTAGSDEVALSCFTDWDIDGVAAVGEDREVISVEDWRRWRRSEQQDRLIEL